MKRRTHPQCYVLLIVDCTQLFYFIDKAILAFLAFVCSDQPVFDYCLEPGKLCNNACQTSGV